MSLRPSTGIRLDRVTRAALVAILLAQATAIVVTEPWPEGTVLLTLGAGHGVTVGDLPAVALVVLAAAVMVVLRASAQSWIRTGVP